MDSYGARPILSRPEQKSSSLDWLSLELTSFNGMDALQ